MANTQALAISFKVDQLNAIHAFGTTVVRAGTGADAFKFALYQTSANIGSATSAYSSSNEVSSAGYTAGGVAVTNANAPTSSGTTAYWTPSATLSWTGVTFTTDAGLLYNSTQSNKAVGVFTFGSQTVTAGNFSLNMPANDSTHALLQIN